MQKLRQFIRKRSFFKKLYDECDDLAFIFERYPEDKADKRAEERYKVVVTTILPLLLSHVRAIFFLLAFSLGLLLARCL